MKRFILLATISGVVLLGGPAGAAPEGSAAAVSDEVTTQVRRLMKKGADEYGSEHWEAARAAYAEAWDLRHHFAVAANLADVEMRLGRYRDAAEHLEFHLANLPKERVDRRADAEKRLAECRTHLGRLRVSVTVEGATIRLDGREIGHAPLGRELWLDPDKHVIGIDAPGYKSYSREFAAEAGATLDVAIALEPVPPLSAPQPGASSPESTGAPASTSSSPGVAALSPQSTGGGVGIRPVVIISTGVLAAAALGIGVIYRLQGNAAVDDTHTLQTEIDAQAQSTAGGSCTPTSANASVPPQCGQLQDKIQEANGKTDLSTGAFITGGVLSVATIGMLLFWPSYSEKSAPPSVAVAPWAFQGVTGAVVRCRF